MTEQTVPTQDPISAVPAPPPASPAPAVERDGRPDGGRDLHDPALYDNRELSWVSFNERVLELAEQEDVPLMERVKFAAIFTSNLDEFFMIRVAGVHDQVDAGLTDPGADGRRPIEVLDAIRERVVEDRKSTRLNSSHANISYAVFCLKKKKKIIYQLYCTQGH